MPASELKTIPITWPFAVWCLDMVGPFKPARGNMTHILVMVDKFTKWAEAKPIQKCDGKTAVKFLKDIILRYGYPHSIISDNGTNFAEGAFQGYVVRKESDSTLHQSRTHSQMDRWREPMEWSYPG